MLIVLETSVNSFLASFYFSSSGSAAESHSWKDMELLSLMISREIKEVREDTRTRYNHWGNASQ